MNTRDVDAHTPGPGRSSVPAFSQQAPTDNKSTRFRHKLLHARIALKNKAFPAVPGSMVRSPAAEPLAR
ncbi:MAG TPA: hypothetical protein DHU56_11770 [Marinobacter sp.]|nr:hypothetical protein [Marinobacter sp.]